MVSRDSGTTFSSRQVVEMLYLGVLGRRADQAGLEAYVKVLDDNPERLEEVASSFYSSDEHMKPESNQSSISDHTQDGELRLLLKALVKTGQRHGIIVDVGARGRERSNSYDLLSQFGWRGLLVEANPSLLSGIQREFAGTHYSLIGCAIGLEEGRMPFFIGTNDDVSSLLADHAASWGAVRDEIMVDVRSLPSVLEQAGIPPDFDVLSLDIEGLDVQVFRNLIETTPYRPNHVIIEASYDYATKSLDDIDVGHAVRHAYRIGGQTRPNLLLERR